MTRVAALLCVCSLALAACHVGSRATIVRTLTPAVPVCLDGRDADTPAWRRICPTPVPTVRAAARHIGAARLRTSARLAPSDLRRSDVPDEAARRAYIEGLILRRASLATPLPPRDATRAIDASLQPLPAVDTGVAPLPFAPVARELRGSLD